VKLRDREDKRLVLISIGVFLASVPLLIVLNMVLFDDSVTDALVAPYMWLNIIIFGGILLYFNK
jgi:uncharacterized membrane protein YqgA involved in biofilm formation